MMEKLLALLIIVGISIPLWVNPKFLGTRGYIPVTEYPEYIAYQNGYS